MFMDTFLNFGVLHPNVPHSWQNGQTEEQEQEERLKSGMSIVGAKTKSKQAFKHQVPKDTWALSGTGENRSDPGLTCQDKQEN